MTYIYDNRIQVNISSPATKCKISVQIFDHFCHHDPVISVCLVLVSIQICLKYEGSMITHIGRRGKYRTKKNGCHLKNMGHIDLIVYVHTLGAYVYDQTCG